MHPHSSYTCIAAVAHELRCNFRSRDDHDAVHSTGYRFQIGITLIALEGSHLRVDCEHIVPGGFQSVIDEIADWMVALVARHSGDGDPLLCEEVLNFCFERVHLHCLPPCAYGRRTLLIWLRSARLCAMPRR